MGVTSGFISISCDSQMSETCYDELVNCPDDSEWLCPNCRSVNLTFKEDVTASPLDVKQTPVVNSSGEVNSVTCLCLNSRSVVSKRSDLFAYLCCYHVDVLAITGTFLDGLILDTEICPCNYVLL